MVETKTSIEAKTAKNQKYVPNAITRQFKSFLQVLQTKTAINNSNGQRLVHSGYLTQGNNNVAGLEKDSKMSWTPSQGLAQN